VSRTGRIALLVGAVAVSVVAVAGLGGWLAWRSGSVGGTDCPGGPPQRLGVEVLDRIPHDPTAFTEGLVRVGAGRLWESTGREGESSIRRLDPATGAVLEQAALPPDAFGEGLAVGDGGELVQLTWKNGFAVRWQRSPLQATGRFTYRGEGWGLSTLDDGTLVQSDGTDTLTLRDPATFEVTSTQRIARDGGGADRLNELEWDGTHLWANRWQTDEILRIDLDCDRVDAVVDASALTAEVRAATRAGGEVDVLNGIARGPRDGTYYVTGKLWPTMFVVRFVTSP